MRRSTIDLVVREAQLESNTNGSTERYTKLINRIKPENMTNLMYAEVSVTEEMRADKLVAIIGDTGVFLVTTKENSKKYPNEEFFNVTDEGYEAYKEELNKLIKQ